MLSRIKTWSSVAMRWPWHPFFVASWFVLFPLARNIRELELSSGNRALLIVLASTGLLLWLFKLVLGSWYKAGLVTTLVLILLLGFGYVQVPLESSTAKWPLVGWLFKGRLFIPLALGGIGYLTYWLRNNQLPQQYTRLLNLTAAILIALNLWTLGGHWFANRGRHVAIDPAVALSKNAELPDIYYLLPDDYTSNEVLKDYLNFDNSQFSSWLEEHGFKVWNNAYSNYPDTTWSLPSILNLRYLDKEAQVYRGKTAYQPIKDLIDKNLVVRSLQKIGYRYVHVGSWWQPTRSSSIADQSLVFGNTITVFNRSVAVSEFEQNLIYQSLARVLLHHEIKLGNFVAVRLLSGAGEETSRAFLEQINATTKIVSLPGPKFVFVHYLMPHTPYVFDQECNVINTALVSSDYQRYIHQLQCTNRKLEEAIGTILRNSSKEPIIVMQSDEGTWPPSAAGWNKPGFKWADLDSDSLRIKFGTLRAVRFPGKDLSAINIPASADTFTALFNAYFDAGLELKGPKYFGVHPSEPYNFSELVGRLNPEDSP